MASTATPRRGDPCITQPSVNTVNSRCLGSIKIRGSSPIKICMNEYEYEYGYKYVCMYVCMCVYIYIYIYMNTIEHIWV